MRDVSINVCTWRAWERGLSSSAVAFMGVRQLDTLLYTVGIFESLFFCLLKNRVNHRESSLEELMISLNTPPYNIVLVYT